LTLDSDAGPLTPFVVSTLFSPALA